MLNEKAEGKALVSAMLAVTAISFPVMLSCRICSRIIGCESRWSASGTL